MAIPHVTHSRKHCRRRFHIGLTLSLLALLVACVSGKTYADGEPIPVLVNHIFSYKQSKSGKIHYYELPYCEPDGVVSRQPLLSAALRGEQMFTSNYELRFKEQVRWASVCVVRLRPEESDAFIRAIKAGSVYEMYVDSLPLKSEVGVVRADPITGNPRYHLNTYLQFNVQHDGSHIVSVNASTLETQQVALDPSQINDVEFSYSVFWEQVNVPYMERAQYHAQRHDLRLPSVEWTYVFLSLFAVCFAVIVAFVILHRRVHHDASHLSSVANPKSPVNDIKDLESPAYAHSTSHLDDISDHEISSNSTSDGSSDSSLLRSSSFASHSSLADAASITEGGAPHSARLFRLLKVDILRPPPKPGMLSAVLGAGAQLCLVLVSVLCLCLVGAWYPATITDFINAGLGFYTLSSLLAGYVAGHRYLSFGGRSTTLVSLAAVLVFPLPVLITFLAINMIALASDAPTFVPFTTVFLIAFVWVCASIPLSISGGLLALRFASPPTLTLRSGSLSTTSSSQPFLGPLFLIVPVSALLPFLAASVPSHALLKVMGTPQISEIVALLGLVAILLAATSALVTMTLMYYMITSLNPHWWWSSVVAGASPGLAFASYALFYYISLADVETPLMTAMYCAHTLVGTSAAALILAFISFSAAERFVFHFYSAIKTD